MTDDTHPLWTSIVSDIVATEYSFQPPPNGLSHTTQVHIQQAAKSIENHWSAELYQKSFRYTALNALRLRLAPERFQKNEQHRIAKAVEKAKTDAMEEAEAEAEEDAEQRPKPFSLMRWRGLIKDRFNELGRVVRKHDTDDAAMPRVNAILKSIRHLKEEEPQCSDGPPKLIEKISLRQREAQARAEANVPSQQPGQEGHNDKSLGQSTDDNPADEDEAEFDGLCPDDEDQEQAAVEFDEQFTEGDLQAGQDIDVDDPVGEQKVESSGSQIKRLFTVVNILVHSPHIHNRVNKGNVEKALLKNMVCTDQELIAARDLVNALLPFTPKRVLTENGHRHPTPHVVLFSPMVTIAQAFLHEVGLQRFQRQLSPQVSVGSTSALQLSSSSLYEILGSSSGNQFDITAPSGQLIKCASDAAMPANKEAVFAAFFDLDRVQSICLDRNLVFSNRYDPATVTSCTILFI